MTDKPQHKPHPTKHPLVTKRADGEVRITKSHLPEAVAERKRLFLEAYAGSRSKAEAAGKIGLARSNVTYWERTDPEFREAMAEVRHAYAEEVLLPKVYDLALGEASKDGIPHFQALKFLLERSDPEQWGPKSSVTHSGVIFHSNIPDADPLDALEIVDIEGEMVENEE